MSQPNNSNGIRLDQLAVDLCGKACKSMLEPQFQNAPLWDKGLKQITEAAVKNIGVPSKEVTVLDFAKGLGLFRE
jgi:hypothetical protein